jgi:BASS family bile acid:Na+ symporter
VAHGEIITLPFFETVANIFLMIVVPVIAGILYRRWKENAAHKIEIVLKYVSIILLAFVFGFAIILNKDGEKSLLHYYIQVTPHVLLLNFLGMVAGFLVSKLYKFSKDILITIPIEVGLQNSTLAITLAISATFLNSPLTAVPATVYGMFTFFTTLLFGYLIRRFVKE